VIPVPAGRPRRWFHLATRPRSKTGTTGAGVRVAKDQPGHLTRGRRKRLPPRPEPESNRRGRLCRPLPNHSVIGPNALNLALFPSCIEEVTPSGTDDPETAGRLARPLCEGPTRHSIATPSHHGAPPTVTPLMTIRTFGRATLAMLGVVRRANSPLFSPSQPGQGAPLDPCAPRSWSRTGT
jgi:hypothetical protein